MKSLSYRESSPGYGEENDTHDYGFKLKIKEKKNTFKNILIKKGRFDHDDINNNKNSQILSIIIMT